MNNFVLQIWDDESIRVTYYTVKWDDKSDSETDRFFIKHNEDADYQEATQELISLLFDVIGNKYGAIDAFFNRNENKAQALPPTPKDNPKLRQIDLNYAGFPLRLYCYRLSETIVILFNGGVKSAATAQESKDLGMKFYEANQFATNIEEALRAGIIEINETQRYLIDYLGNQDNIDL